jgi:Holliday junction resolvasome RuvABC endonuclease subunit
MKTIKTAFLLGTALGVALLFSATPSNATQKYAKETGKKCLDCHTKVPKKGATDHLLNELGKKFAENGHKLPK